MQKTNSNTTEFKMLCDFLLQNHDKAYKSPLKANNAEEKKEMDYLFLTGKKSNNIFNELISLLAEQNNLLEVKNRNFLDGSCRKIRSYFWGQLKFAEYYQWPESISVFCEVVDNKQVRFRVSLEINERNADEEDIANFLRVLDKPLKKNLCYMGNVKFNRGLEVLSLNNNEIKEQLATGKYNKIQVTYLANACEKDGAVLSELDKGIKLLLPYYEFIMN